MWNSREQVLMRLMKSSDERGVLLRAPWGVIQANVRSVHLDPKRRSLSFESPLYIFPLLSN